ncbi:galactose oxidase [Parathielavia appendiculata]|uniref:Galactose oxidase n=1 Tax=Parathielavia appendiculata TaxID=2587402 RepID=A0AAN6TYX0_9PEZI|nr:galactose oxidase [Parathielavia appendiculata]
MDSFKLLKRRTTELFHSLEQSLPSLGSHGSNAMKATWEKIQVPPLPRSSHSADIVAGTLYIFGGEVEPRRPVDNDMHAITLPSSGAQADYYAIKAKPAKPSAPTEKLAGKSPARLDLPDVPAPRVGHATAVIGHRIFMFGGRGGPDMTALDEGGRVWVFDTRTHLWSSLDPLPAAAGLPDIPRPAPRSYHSAVAIPKPDTFGSRSAPTHHPSQNKNNNSAEAWRDWALGANRGTAELGTPQRPIVGVLAERATDADSDGYGTFIIHGGCLSGSPARASDVWAFDVRSRVWQRLPDAPGAPRGGTALALSRGRLYRFGGFNGETQEGGQLDFLELGVDMFDDQVIGGVEAVLCARGGGWKSVLFGKEDVGYKEVDPAAKPLDLHDTEEWPGNRSVCGLEAVTVGGGREYLVLMFGEREASGVGHAGAGRFWDDVWAFQVPAQGMSLASVADTAFSVVGKKSGEGSWTRVQMGPHDDEDDASAEGPGPRGWTATAPMGELEENGIVVFGGLNEGNQRLGDGWILRLG